MDTAASSSSASAQNRTSSRGNNNDDDEHFSSTVGLLEIASGSSEPDSLRKRRLITSHRRVLEFIRTDAVESRRHAVPQMHFERQSEHRYLRRMVGNFFGTSDRSVAEWIEAVAPMASWLKTYDFRTNFITDLVAGLTVGVMIIPQSMSYAKIAGLPVEYGLYSAVFPIYAYALFGSSRQLAVGPVAIISLILSSGLSTILEGYTTLEPGTSEYQEKYNQIAIQISFLVGIAYISLGSCRMGFVTNFLSHAVISGFTTGAAVIIGMSQVKFIMGYDIERSDRFDELIFNILKNIEQFNWRTFLFGSASICFLMCVKTASKTSSRFHGLRAAGPLTITAISIILTVVFDLENTGIPIVGRIPSGLPPFTVSYWTPVQEARKLMAVVSSITIVGFMESIAIAKQLASKHKYQIDPSKELIALGMSVSLLQLNGSFTIERF